MEENKLGKKPIIVEENIEKTDISKRPIILNESNKNTGFAKSTKSPKWIYIFIIVIVLIVIAFILLNRKADIETIKDSVVMIKVYDKNNNELSTGSGFCAYESNYVITNFHVIEGAYRIKIVTDDNKEYNINKVLIFSSEDDLAIISGNFELKPIEIGNVSGLKAGNEITAIGSPKGQLNTVSTGVISNADNDYEIRITAPISPGSSGGVLLDKKGNVIGITFATYNSIDSQNINYAISAKYLDEMYNSLIKKSYKEVTDNNFKEFVPNITNNTAYFFETIPFNRPDKLSFKGKKDNYYSVNSLEMFCKATNKRDLFENAISDFGEYSLKNEYNQMNDEEKDEVISNYEILQTYNSYNKELSDNISSWSKEQFILELKLMQGQDLAIFMVQLKKINTKDEFIKLIEKMGESYETNIILYRLIYNDDNTYNKDIVYSLSEIDYWTYEQKIEILKYLGMTVLSDETVKW